MTHLEANVLFDLYGSLLTKRQQEILVLSIQEDLSYGEIAQELGISRAAVLDAIKRAEQLLEGWEAKLGFRKKREQVLALLEGVPELQAQVEEIL